MSERLDDDVLVCRCEEVTAGDIRRAIRAGATDVTQVKLRTRADLRAAGAADSLSGAGCPAGGDGVFHAPDASAPHDVWNFGR